jgi:acetoin utilization protein AcuB
MAVIMAINGVVEAYPIKPHVRSPSVEAASPQGDAGTSDRSSLAARHAYEQQRQQERSPARALTAGDLMTAPATTLPSDGTLAQAWALMQRDGFRHVPIVSMDGTVVGMVSDRDVLRHAPDLVLTGTAGLAAHRRLADIMAQRVFSATPTTDIRDIARVMVDEHIHAVPILDVARRPVGILTARDLIRGIATRPPLELWT